MIRKTDVKLFHHKIRNFDYEEKSKFKSKLLNYCKTKNKPRIK